MDAYTKFVIYSMLIKYKLHKNIDIRWQEHQGGSQTFHNFEFKVTNFNNIHDDIKNSIF